MIVVASLAVIAAIVYPHFSRGSELAIEMQLHRNVKALREAVQRYAVEHHGVYPGDHPADGSGIKAGVAVDFYRQLTEQTDVNGKVGIGPAYPYGPYLKEIPALNIGANSKRLADEVSYRFDDPLEVRVLDQTGWIYNPETGQIIANLEEVDSQGVPMSTY